MQHSAVFLGGALLGGVLAAACGFDLYPIEEAAHSTLVDLRSRSDGLERALGDARIEHRRTLEAQALAAAVSGRLGDDLELSRRELATARRDLDTARAEKDTLAGRLDDVESDAAAIAAELALARDERTQLAAALARAHGATLATRRDLSALALRFFSTPRPAADLDLAAAFLSGDRREGEILALVVELRRYSPELLLSLGFARPDACRLETVGGGAAVATGVPGVPGEFGAAAIVPASSSGTTRPVAALE